MTRYVVITPVRDEEEYLEATIASVLGQSILPARWVIVDDGSTDRTGQIIDEYAARYPLIQAVHRPNRGFRKAGGGVMEAFYEGYQAIDCDDWEFLVKLDGDLSFSTAYFQHCFERFKLNTRLGIGGGVIYHEIGQKLTVESGPKFHVRGATKIYRRSCWDDIGGLWRGAGWDTLDEVKANMLGWKTGSFADLHLIHHRLTGTADGLLRDRVKYGTVCFTCGYHPLFVLARCVYRSVRKPYLIGSLAMCWGYLKGYFTSMPRVDDGSLIRYVQGQQLRRLCGLETMWK